MTMTFLDTAIVGQQRGTFGYYNGVPGYYSLQNGAWVFYPLTDTEIGNVPLQTLFITPAEVIGYITYYQVNVSGTLQDFGGSAMVGQEFELAVTAHYASAKTEHTKMLAYVYGPSGSLKYTLSDDDLWPRTGPNKNINFYLTGFAGEAYNIDEAGTWTIRLSYVWVH